MLKLAAHTPAVEAELRTLEALAQALAHLTAAPRLDWAMDTWPDAIRGDSIPVPFPVIEGWQIVPRAGQHLRACFVDAPLLPVPLGALWATQPGILRPVVRRWLLAQGGADPASASEVPGPPLPWTTTSWEGYHDWPWVLRMGARDYIYDGHHRLAAQRYLGQETAQARVVDWMTLR